MNKPLSRCFVFFSLLILLSPAIATEKNTHDGQTTVKKRSASVEVGFVRTGGNSDTETLNSKLDLATAYHAWKHSLRLEALNNSSNDERSAEKYLASMQSDYAINKRSYFLAFLTGEKDRFSGFDYQASLGLGYGYKIIEKDNMGLNFELGAGYRISELEDGAKQEDAILRLAEKYFWQLSETSKIEQSFNSEIGEENTVTRFGLSLTSKVVGSLSMKLGYQVKHNSDVPTGSEKTDYETSVTLVYSM